MIVLNQLGYLPEGRKVAVLTDRAATFHVCDSEGANVYTGEGTYFGRDEASGDEVWLADFSRLTAEGTYYLSTPEGRRSPDFRIGKDVYDHLLYDLTRAYYYLRCGMDLTEACAGPFVHKACHCSAASEWGHPEVQLDVRGGWHDAGDYGRYVTAAATALGHLLYAMLLYPKVLNSLHMNIPDHAENVPDLLTECRYELEWVLKMQRADGGVYHKETTAAHAPFVMPEEDLAPLFLLPVSSMATADFAAVTALASRVYRTYDETFADRLLAASKRSAGWLVANPDMVAFENPEGCSTGGYGEGSDRDNRFWAWAELYRTTGRTEYREYLEQSLEDWENSEQQFSFTALGYASVAGFGAMAMLVQAEGLKSAEGWAGRDQSLRNMLRREVLTRADDMVEASDECGYGVAMRERDYNWGSNMLVAARGMILALARMLTGENRYMEYAANELHYLLGKNAMNLSYVTGNGTNACAHPHLRPAFADGIDACIPGMVSGGPNRRPCDETAVKLVPPGTPAMKSYADHVRCYSLNEITIYWNSPAVFTLAAVLDYYG